MSVNSNLLEDWYKEARVISSPFNIRQKIPRETIDNIYNVLKSFFPPKFFNAKSHFDSPIEKISWLFSLLSNKGHLGSIGALNEIVGLINYSKQLNLSIQNELHNLITNPQNLRSFFFELYIYSLLDRNNIPNKKKISAGNQIIEGTFTYLGSEYLFECRKLYLPKINDLDILRRIMTDFRQSNKMKYGIGMICTIKLNRPLTGKHRSYFKKIIQDYFSNFNKPGFIRQIDYHVESEFGEFKAVDYNEITMIELRGLKKYDILFYLIPPKFPIADQNNLYTGKIICNFSFYQSGIYKKLEMALKEKKKQHKKSEFAKKVIFLDSEHLPEFQMGLFQSENMFDIAQAQAVYEKLDMSETVCILRRNYSLLKSNLDIAFLYRDNEANLIERFKTMFT